MNTTKDECDGWVEMPSRRPMEHQTVLIWTKTHGCVTGVWHGGFWSTEYGLRIENRDVTHWRELPEPPKPKDAFEAWWRGESKTDYDSLVVTKGEMDFCADKEIARYIWEAAINSTKQC